MSQLTTELKRILIQAKFAETCCDKPEDRMYHAADDTWWERVGNEWRIADPPPGWQRKTDVS